MLTKLHDLIFDPYPLHSDLFSRTFLFTALFCLFLAGVAHWVVFLQYGDMSFAAGDWRKELVRYATLEALVKDPVIPYFINSWGNSRFLGIPETVLSPQIFLLLFMGVGKFILVNTLVMYSIGFLGCLLIRWKYQISLLPFTILFLLFNFNGHITAHISAGHLMWNGYFLLPFFVYLVLEIVRPDNSSTLKTPLLLALVLFGIILQGSFHMYFWCLIFLGLVGLFNKHALKGVFIAGTFSVWLSLFRLLPPVFIHANYRLSYASGFPSANTFFDALTTIKTFQFEHVSTVLDEVNAFYDIGWHEIDHFIGYLGLAFIVFFGIYVRFSGARNGQYHKFQALDVPILLLVLFSFGFWFDILNDLRIPFFSWSERIISRFFIIPLIFLVVLSTIRMQDLLHVVRDNTVAKVLLLAGIVQLGHSLAAHSWFWRTLTAVGKPPGAAPPEFTFNPPGQVDLLYTTAVNVSGILSIAALITVGVLLFRTVGWIRVPGAAEGR